MPKGDCFTKAWEVAYDAAKDGEELLICHGYPTGRGGEAEGQLYAHAWNERVDVLDVPFADTMGEPQTMRVTVVTAIDKSNGLDVDMPRGLFYKLGNIDEDEVSRYTVKEAAGIMLIRGHYGPWHGPEEAE